MCRHIQHHQYHQLKSQPIQPQIFTTSPTQTRTPTLTTPPTPTTNFCCTLCLSQQTPPSTSHQLLQFHLHLSAKQLLHLKPQKSHPHLHCKLHQFLQPHCHYHPYICRNIPSHPYHFFTSHNGNCLH